MDGADAVRGAILAAVLLLAGCASTEPQFGAVVDNRQMVVFVFDGERVRHVVLPHDPDNAPGCRVVTGPVSELKTLMTMQQIGRE